MTVYGIQFWIECKGGLKTANELSDTLDDLVYDGNLSLAYSNHSIMGAGLFMKNAVQNNFESIREILNEFADKIKYVSEWDYEDSSDMKWGVHTLGESKKSVRKSINESINANSILSKVETIVGKTKIKHPKAEIIELDGTKYIYYSYFDRGFDDDALDRVWDKCSDLKGVVDVGFGYGYGLKNTKYENSLLIELDDDVIVESKKSARKSIKESRGQTVAELLQNASSKTIVYIFTDRKGDEFLGTNDQLKGEFSKFL